MKYKGFSLVEILMVLILLGVLSAIGTSTFINFSNDAKIKVTTERLNELKRAIVGDPRQVSNGRFVNPGFENHIGALPTTLTQLTTQGALATYNAYNKTGWRGPYIDSTVTDWNKDAWGTTIVYASGARSLTSYGPNLAAGGGDDIVVTF